MKNAAANVLHALESAFKHLGAGAGVACGEQREKGSEAVELALVLPLITLFIAGALDLGMVGMVANQTESVAVEAARYAAHHPECDTSSALKAVIEGNHPGLVPSADYKLDVKLEYGAEEIRSYTHHFAVSGGEYDTRASMTCSQPVAVTVTYSRPYYTPIGAAWGGSDTVTLTAAAVSRIDKTDGEIW